MYTRNCEIKQGVEFPVGMNRIALGVEYRGDELHGFQKQASADDTVQAYLERALSKVAAEHVSLVCAGRTDAGVHATGQVVHFDTVADRPSRAWVLGTNSRLPDAIRVHWAADVGPRFHARFSAASRTYCYLLYNGPVVPATLGRQVTAIRYPLNIDLMSKASRALLGTHDFNAFRSSQCQASNAIRTLHAIDWFRQGELIIMEIKANAFLHHMVRNIVGSLFEIGRGKRDDAWLKDVLRAQNRNLAGATAPPFGLYLVDVEYDKGFKLPNSEKSYVQGPYFLGNFESL